jgi:hypothetical protein
MRLTAYLQLPDRFRMFKAGGPPTSTCLLYPRYTGGWQSPLIRLQMKGGKDWRDAAAKTGDDLRRIGGRSVDDAFTLPRAEMTSWPGAFLTRLEPLALVQRLNAEILASRRPTVLYNISGRQRDLAGGDEPAPGHRLYEAGQRQRMCVLMTRHYWTCAIVTTLSALVSAGFSVVGLFGPSGSGSFERYAASRSFALLIAVLCCIGFRSRDALAAIALVMSLVQGFDGLIGMLAHDPTKTYGPFAFALVNFAALAWLLGSHEHRNAG